MVRGRYQILPRSLRISVVLADTVFCEVSPDTQYIVELGSGWGQNLFQVYCRIAGNAVKYAACELTESGRRVTDMISALDQGMDCATYAFDYRNPDLSFLEGKPNVVFFSCHSIEQIKDLSPALFDLMLEKTGKCVGVHFEPVGWQRMAELSDLAHADGAPKEEEFRVDDSMLLKNAAQWSINRNHNRNLLEVVDGLQKAGKIRLKLIDYDMIGMNPFNPSTCIVWEKG